MSLRIHQTAPDFTAETTHRRIDTRMRIVPQPRDN
jgi:hypothetical protein